MEKVNKKLNAKNKIVCELNSKFYVFGMGGTPAGEKYAYSAYKVNENNNKEYYFSIESVNSDKTVTFNGKRYSDTESLINAVDEYNSSLKYPLATYDPILSDHWRMEERVLSYLKDTVGFKAQSDGEYGYSDYVLETSNGNRFMTLGLSRTSDKDTIRVSLDGKTSMIFEITDEDSAIRTINVFLMSSCASAIKMATDVSGSLFEGFAMDDNIKEFDGSIRCFLDGGYDPREKVLKQLEDAAEAIRESLKRNSER